MRPAHALVPLAVLIAVVTGVALYAVPRRDPPLPEARVRLAVLVVFDQLRADLIDKWAPLFRPDGFARLKRDGAWFTNCHYPYATTTTGPGHASMLTGACGDVHGIVNNDWFENGKRLYCAGAPAYGLVPSPDPEVPMTGGTPERLLSETVADVLKRQTRGRARVFGVSLKDRSAILPTGKRPDGAFWFQHDGAQSTGLFVTSTYYTPATGSVPEWVQAFNASRAADRWKGIRWTRLGPAPLYDLVAGPDNHPGEGIGMGDPRRENQGIAFPHPMVRSQYYAALTNSPFGNDLLLDFAKTCAVEERLGLHDAPDLLVISFSSNDLIGHTWGPDSHEVLDVTLRSDAIVAQLLAFLDGRVGPGGYLLGLTADHGVCQLPEVAREEGKDAGRVNPEELRRALDKHLSGVFATDPKTEWVDVAFPWFYLKAPAVRAHGVLRERATAEAVKFLAKQPGVARTFTHAELLGPVPPGDEVAVKMKRSFHPGRCGDMGVVLKPYWIAFGKTGTTHGAPYDYDTHVPLLVYGPGIRGGPRTERTTPQALASIFARWLDIPRPKDAAFPIPTTLE
jgi:hypothetical protein